MQDIDKQIKNLESGRLIYPNNVDVNSPFIYLGAYKFQPLTDARQYAQSVLDLANRKYDVVFCFYVPSSLKFSYNPSVDTVDARISKDLMKAGDGTDLLKGVIETGLTNFYLDAKNSGNLIEKIMAGARTFRELSSGKIFDPKQLNMFKDPGFLNYNLNYRFMPETRDEAITVNVIIELLRRLSTPSISDSDNIADWLKGVADAVVKITGQEGGFAETVLNIPAKLMEEINKLTQDDKNQSITNIDTWQHPYIWDMYLITPQESKLNSDNTIDSNKEFHLFRPAKGLIIDGLQINMLPAHDRDDVPFYQDGTPLGYEVDISFKSISKVMNPK